MLSNHPIFVVLAAAVVAPLLAELPIGRRVPVVVLEVILGIVIGPHVLGLIQFDGFVDTMLKVGMAAVLFMAGMEIDFEKIRGRALSLALRGWVISGGIAFLAIAVLHLIRDVQAPLMATIALTTTSLGALLPILRDNNLLEAPFGRMVLAAGTVAEVGPIVAVSLALSDRYSTWQEFVFLGAFLGIVALAAAVGMGARPPTLLALLSRPMHASTQLPVRLALLALAALFVLSEEFGFEGILGAFAAGMIVGLTTRGKEGELFRVKIDAVCFGWFTPFFFVGTGVAFDLGALTRNLATMILVPTLATTAVRTLLFRRVTRARRYDHADRVAGKEHEPGYCPGADRSRLALVVGVSDRRLRTVVTGRGFDTGLLELRLSSRPSEPQRPRKRSSRAFCMWPS